MIVAGFVEIDDFFQAGPPETCVERRLVKGDEEGKTTIAAWLILWFAPTRDGNPKYEDWKIPTTASAWRQLTKFLWPRGAQVDTEAELAQGRT